MKKLHYYFLLVFIALGGSTIAQEGVDSLFQVLQASTVDSVKMQCYIDLVQALETEDPERALEIGEEAINFSKNQKDPAKLAELFASIAIVHTLQNNNQESIPYMLRALEYWQDAGNESRIARTYANLGIISRRVGDYSQALDYQLQGLRIYDALRDTSHIISSLVSVVAIYTYQDLYEQAKNHLQRAHELSSELGDAESIATTSNSFGNLHMELGEYEEAAEYFELSLDKFRELNDIYHIAKISTNLGIAYRKAGNYEAAEANMLSSLAIFERHQAKVEAATVQINLSKVYHLQGKYAQAISVAEQAISVFNEIGALTELRAAHESLSISYEAAGKYQLALEEYKKYLQIKDSLLNEEISLQINDLNTKYETERKEKEIVLLKQQNQVKEKQKLMIIGAFILLGVIALGFFINFRQKRLHEAQAAKSKLEQHLREIDILRDKIAEGTTQYASPQEFSVEREEINKYLQDPLTERELEILYLLAEGLPNKEIGERVFLSVNTIKFHLQKIYVKLEVSNRTQAVKEMTRLSQRAD